MLSLVILTLSLAGASLAAEQCERGFNCVSFSECAELESSTVGLKGAAKRVALLAAVRSRACSNERFTNIKKAKVCCKQDVAESIPQTVEDTVSAAGSSERSNNAPSFNRLTYHILSGRVRVQDPDHLVVEKFAYDGDAPDAFFVVGVGASAGEPGVIDARSVPVPYPAVDQRLDFNDPSMPVLPAYDGSQDLVLTMPEGVDAREVRWLSVYCRQYDIDFGHAILPVQATGDVPRA